MKMNPPKLKALFQQTSSSLTAKSRDLLRRFDPGAAQNPSDLNTYDESVLQQGRFWMRTVTWSLIGTTVFGVAWLALARTEEIVVAAGELEPIGSVQDIQMPVGGSLNPTAQKFDLNSASVWRAKCEDFLRNLKDFRCQWVVR